MKTYSKEQLQQMAAEHFEKLGVEKLYATSDGQFFLLENRAKLHASGRNVYPLFKDEATEKKQPSGLSMDKLTKKVNGCTDVEKLREMMLEEVGGENRTEAVELIDAKIRELIHDENDPAFRGDAPEETKPAKEEEAKPQETQAKKTAAKKTTTKK